MPELTTASAMFSSSAVEKVTISNLKKVTTANRMFWRAKKFHADHLNWELDSVENMEMMFDGTNNFKGEVHFTNLGKLTNAAQMFNDSSVTKVTFSETPNLTTTARMFQGAKTSDITLSNLKNVQDIEKMFNKASNFN